MERERWAIRVARSVWRQKQKRNTFIRRYPQFWLLLKTRQDFIQTPRDRQRISLITRALDDLSADLRHAHTVARRFVRGRVKVPIEGDWRTSPAHYDGSRLVIAGQQVMQDWERPIMKAMAEYATERHGDVLEVGFGMGISATHVQECGVRSHTIIEYNDDVIAQYHRWKQRYQGRDIRLIPGKWQDVTDRLGTYDGILFDTYPISEEESHHLAAEPFLPVAVATVRPGGIFTHFMPEIDSVSRRYQRLILQHFDSLELRVVRPLAPPEDCNYWSADSMVVVKATK